SSSCRPASTSESSAAVCRVPESSTHEAAPSTFRIGVSSKPTEAFMRRWMTVVSMLLGTVLVHVDAQTDFQWRGQLTSGQTLEVKGINGDVRAVPSSTTDVEVTATKSARRSNPA